MKKFTAKSIVIVLLILSIITITVYSCSSSGADENKARNRKGVEKLDTEQMAKSLNEFSFDIFKSIEGEVRKNDKNNTQNVFISPFIIYTALSMTNNGAGNGLREGISKVLKIGDYDIDRVNASLKYLTDTLEEDSRNVKLMVANSIWQAKGFKILKDFKNILSNCYDALIESVDFANPSTKDKINKWISDNTNNLIKKMIEKTNPNDVMYLVNAIFFYGQWLREFDKDLTKKSDFTLLSGKKVTAEMMKSESKYMYGETPDMQSVRLSYGKLKDGLTDDQKNEEILKTDEHISMYLFLPKDKKTVYDIMKKLNSETLEKVIGRMRPTDLKLRMPKFKIDFRGPFKEILDNLVGLGMPVSNDFSNMTNDNGNLFISKVLHQAVVKVNEEGTEAAGATVVAVTRSMSMKPEFNADKPFVFIIRDDKTKAILFTGILKDPTGK